MKVDLEIGGSDQTFNMLCGRTLVKKMLKKDKFVMTTPLLTDSQGVKIGKTEGNVIALNDNPNDLFGKIMALGDDIIIKGLEYLTDLSTKDLDVSANPMKYKKQLAFEIVKQLNNDQAAKKAQEQFETIVQGKEMPSEIRRLTFTKTFMSNATITDALEKSGMVSSKSEAKRVVGQGGTAVYDSKITDPNALIAPLMKNEEIIIRVGKRNIVKIGTES